MTEILSTQRNMLISNLITVELSQISLKALHNIGRKGTLNDILSLSSVLLLEVATNHLLTYADLNLHCSKFVKLKAIIDNPAFDCVLIHNMKIYTTKIKNLFN